MIYTEHRTWSLGGVTFETLSARAASETGLIPNARLISHTVTKNLLLKLLYLGVPPYRTVCIYST